MIQEFNQFVYYNTTSANEPVATDGGTDAAATTDASATDNYSTDIETGPTGTGLILIQVISNYQLFLYTFIRG